jgi:hypothetical protein
MSLNDREILVAFAKHRTEIRQQATQQHQIQNRRVTCTLNKAHFTGGNRTGDA